jgi:hypothetical protein
MMMSNNKMLSLIVCSIFVMLTNNLFIADVFSIEPKSLREHRAKIEKTVSIFEQPREFIITRDDSLFLDKKRHILGNINLKQSFLPKDKVITPEPPCNQYVITPDKDVGNLFYIYQIPLKSFRETLLKGDVRITWQRKISDSPFLGPAVEKVITHPSPSTKEFPRSFFDSHWNDNPIGIFSTENRIANMENHAAYCVTFYRGNILSYVFTTTIGNPSILSAVKDSQIDYELLSKIYETSLNPDPRKVAWRIDQYLKGAPLAKLGNEAKQKIKTLKITLPKDTKFEIGKKYPLDFPRKSPDGAVPTEIRLVVSRGRIQPVLATDRTDSPNITSFVREMNGKYTVLFGQPEKQTIHCYHINEEGKCLAWGSVEVEVKKLSVYHKIRSPFSSISYSIISSEQLLPRCFETYIARRNFVPSLTLPR